jgi:hypothetical protein
MHYVLFLFILVVGVIIFVYFRKIEKYQLPDFSNIGSESDICPPGYLLACVSKDLPGITETVPFPEDLPKPCSDGSIPLCLPHPNKITKPSAEYLLKVI